MPTEPYFYTRRRLFAAILHDGYAQQVPGTGDAKPVWYVFAHPDLDMDIDAWMRFQAEVLRLAGFRVRSATADEVPDRPALVVSSQ